VTAYVIGVAIRFCVVLQFGLAAPQTEAVPDFELTGLGRYCGKFAKNP
jgi:hypothetical protein